MSDHLTPEQRSRAMKRVRLKDGSLEKSVQRELRARGLRFKRHVRALPGRPDIVFAEQKLAVFVDGDFWHGWRLPAWEHKLSPFWRDKLRTNRARDRRNFRRLRTAGWLVVRLWQHDVKRRLVPSIERIVSLVRVCRRSP
ncbi:MAG: DNA mismatch endonuclease Vsr [Verrucomicrobia bacterium]|nr:DNA mismatch endonuclease Vsr [Verrucomicrobiota bacterium]